MARQVITTLVDDLTGGQADETVKFGLDGIQYEIDLSGKNAMALRKAVEPYLAAGTRVGRGGVVPGGRAARGTASATNRKENQAIRAWAVDNGHDVSERGRIPASVVEAFRSRPNGSAPAGKASKK